MGKGQGSTTKTKATKRSSTSKGGNTAETRILKALASHRAMGKPKPERKTIQGFAAMPKKHSFDTTLLNIKKKGLLMYDKQQVWLTDAGLDASGGAEALAPPSDNSGMQSAMKKTIKVKKAHEIFDTLSDGKSYTRSDLAAKMHLKDNKSFGTYLSALSKVVDPEAKKKKMYRLKDDAFPCGRPL